jgi:hypothetical protein
VCLSTGARFTAVPFSVLRVKTVFTGATGSPYFNQMHFVPNSGTEDVAAANAAITAAKRHCLGYGLDAPSDRGPGRSGQWEPHRPAGGDPADGRRHWHWGSAAAGRPGTRPVVHRLLRQRPATDRPHLHPCADRGRERRRRDSALLTHRAGRQRHNGACGHAHDDQVRDLAQA